MGASRRSRDRRVDEGEKGSRGGKAFWVLVPRQHGYVPEDPERTRLGALPGAVQLHG